MTPKYTRLNDLITHTLGSAPAEPQPSEVVSTINAHWPSRMRSSSAADGAPVDTGFSSIVIWSDFPLELVEPIRIKTYFCLERRRDSERRQHSQPHTAGE